MAGTEARSGFGISARWGAKLALFLGFGGLLAILIFSGDHALRVVSAIETQNAELNRAYVERRHVLEVIRSGIYLSSTFLRDYLLEADPEIAAGSRQELRRVHAVVNAALRIPSGGLSPEEAQLFAELQTELGVYWNTLEPVLNWGPRQRASSGHAFLQAEILPRRAALLHAADKVSQLDDLALRTGTRRTAELYASFRSRVLLMLAAGVAVGLLLAGLTIRRILDLEQAAVTRFQEVAQAREQLRELSARLLQAQEQERRAIARELHDEVGQSLSAMLLDLGNLAATLPSGSGESLRLLGGLRELGEKILGEIRDLALLLRPSMLDDLGLVPALEWQAREVARRTGMVVEVTASGVDESLPEEDKTCIYRVVQEALSNCFRHSGARHVEVRVSQQNGRLALEVEDDGHGFDPSAARGLGLPGIEERVSHLGGSLCVESRPGHGTRLRVELPRSGVAA